MNEELKLSGVPALIEKWSRITQVKDLGFIGSALDECGYDRDGFRDLDSAEKKLIAAFVRDLQTLR